MGWGGRLGSGVAKFYAMKNFVKHTQASICPPLIMSQKFFFCSNSDGNERSIRQTSYDPGIFHQIHNWKSAFFSSVSTYKKGKENKNDLHPFDVVWSRIPIWE